MQSQSASRPGQASPGIQIQSAGQSPAANVGGEVGRATDRFTTADHITDGSFAMLEGFSKIVLEHPVEQKGPAGPSVLECARAYGSSNVKISVRM